MKSEKSPGTPRRRGRPPKGADSRELTRASVIEAAYAMTATERLDDLSMVRVAAHLGVSPSLVHYYLASRDALTSGVVNRFFRAVNEVTPAPHPDPWKDIEAVARASYTVMVARPGVVDYLAAHNRFRLVQQVAEGETDHGVLAFERLASAIMRAGYGPHEGALIGHLLRMFVLSCAQAEAHFQTPGFHREFLDQTLATFSRRDHPGLHHSLAEFATLQGSEVFATGMRILLDGYRPRAGGAQAAASPPRAAAAGRSSARPAASRARRSG